MSADHISVDFKGWEVATESALRELDAVLLPRAMERIGGIMTDSAQMLAPVAVEGGGRLRASVVHETERRGAVHSVSVGSNVHYAPYMEYGTGERGADADDGPSYKGHPSGVSYTPGWPGVRPQPYLRPALYDEAELYETIVADAIGEAFR